MASLYGLEIRERKEQKGHEGEVVYSGDLFLHGEYLGSWKEDLTGGPVTYGFDISLVESVVKRYAKDSKREFYDLPMSSILACLLWELNNMINTENRVAEFLQAGYKCVILVTDGCYYIWTPSMEEPSIAMEKNKDAIEQSKQYLSSGKEAKVQLYASLSDFIIE